MNPFGGSVQFEPPIEPLHSKPKWVYCAPMFSATLPFTLPSVLHFSLGFLPTGPPRASVSLSPTVTVAEIVADFAVENLSGLGEWQCLRRRAEAECLEESAAVFGGGDWWRGRERAGRQGGARWWREKPPLMFGERERERE